MGGIVLVALGVCLYLDAVTCVTSLALLAFGVYRRMRGPSPDEASTRRNLDTSARPARAGDAPSMRQTRNPRYKPRPAEERSASGKESAREAPTIAEEEVPPSDGSTSRRTPNPRRKASPTTIAPAPASSVHMEELRPASYFSSEEQNARRLRLQDRPEVQRQSSASRARLLDSMFVELAEKSYRDPALRLPKETGCETLRGRRVWNAERSSEAT